MVKVYIDFEHWGLPFSVSVIPDFGLYIFNILFLTISYKTGGFPDEQL